MKPTTQVVVCKIPVEKARRLRNEILRPGLPRETSVFPGDDDRNTFHAGAFLNGELAGIASIIQEPLPFDNNIHNTWRLRGMAVSKNARGKGCGKALIKICLEHALEHHGSILWCNARTSALPFYESLGFKKHGTEFTVQVSGPHFVLWRKI